MNISEGARYLNLLIEYTDETKETYILFPSVDVPSCIVFTSDGNKTIKVFRGTQQSGTTTLYYDKCGIFEGVLTEADFKPYVRNTLPIPAEVQALDGYGWGVNADCYNYIDWEKKQFIKRVDRVDMGTLEWSGTVSGLYRKKALENMKYKTGTPNLLCADYKTTVTASSEGWINTKPDKTIGFRTDSYIMVKDSAYADTETFKAAMSGVMLYYELAEPVITDISDLLPDDNLIGVEGGGTVTMVNEYGYDVPSEITYQLKGAEA
jgi:hypothetical protein